MGRTRRGPRCCSCTALAEHSGRYEHVGDQLAGAGIDATAYDQRGNGGSAAGAVTSTTGRSSTTTWPSVWPRSGAAPAGGPSRCTAIRPVGWSSPATSCPTGRSRTWRSSHRRRSIRRCRGGRRPLARVLSRVAPTTALPNDIDPSTLSRDATVGQKAGADPASATVTTVRFGAEAMREQLRVRREAPVGGFGVPTLVLHGLDDGLVPATASDVLDGAPGVERRTYPACATSCTTSPRAPRSSTR